jgi:hypothetical protein
MERGTKEQGTKEQVRKGTPDEEKTEGYPEELKRQQALKKRQREAEQRLAEKVQIINDGNAMRRVAERNNAGLRHLTVFINIVEYAKEKRLPVTIIEMKKRLSEGEGVREWQTLRNWLKKNAPEICAVSIGRRPKGWWSLRWIVVGGEPGGDCLQTALPLHAYLVKRGWTTKDLAGSEEAGRLERHYLTRFADDWETFAYFTSEIYEVYRAALTMPKMTRTYRTEGAHGILEERKLRVAPDASYAVNGCYGASPSGRALCEVEVRRGRVTYAWRVGEEEEGEGNGFIE